MKLAVFNPIFYDQDFKSALDQIKNLGLDSVEIGCGNYAGDRHCNPEHLLKDQGKLGEFQKDIKDRGLSISALSCHGNPLHPSSAISKAHRARQHDTILLASKLGVSKIVTFSGCPGDSETSKNPNWVTTAWPEDYPKVLEWQWKERVVPFWLEEADFAEKNGIEKICLEIHPGFVVYNPETMLRLREAVGKIMGANVDPSHLFWQGIDPNLAIRKLRECVYHFHAKDTYIVPENYALNGALDPKSYSRLPERSWYFRTVGYGHDTLVWKSIVSNLSLIGYDDVISIEHEDALFSRLEGLTKAVQFLREIIPREPRPDIWWA